MAVFPPPRHHAQNANRDASGESGQNDENQWCSPLGTKEEVHGRVLLVIQRKREKGKKNGCLK